MRGYLPGARASCFNWHGVTALILITLAIYTYRTTRFRDNAPLATNPDRATFEEQIENVGAQVTFDVDGDGVPDLCHHDEEDVIHCLLSDGSWTTFAHDDIPHPAGPISDGENVSPLPDPAFFVPSAEAPTTTEEPVSSTVESFAPAETSLADEPLPSPTYPEPAMDHSPPAGDESASVPFPGSPPAEEFLPVESTYPDPPPQSTWLSPPLPTGKLPSAAQFKLDNGTRWRIEYVGDIRFTDQLANKNLVGDKSRSGKIGDKVIWNFGDMWCDFDYTICGFAMGPALYGTDDVMVVNTDGIEHIYNWDFLRPHETDPRPEIPFRFWGMDTSNVAPINDTHGVAYAFEIWRGAPDGSDHRCGNAVASITLDPIRPMATRLGPLLTGPEIIEMGMLAIMRDGDYIYIYSEGGPSSLIVTRVPANDDVFDIANYESLEFNNETYSITWSAGVPMPNTTTYGMTASTWDSRFGCSVYGSVFYSNYFNKYIILCNIDMTWTNMYASDTPWGPWSEEYGILSGWIGYGSMAHPEYSPNGSHKEIYFSQGPNDAFNMFKLTFDYDDEDTVP